MLAAKESALVRGALPSQSNRAQAWVRVLRPFYVRGQALQRDSEHSIDAVFAAEMVAANKAQLIDAPAAPANPKPAPAAVTKKD